MPLEHGQPLPQPHRGERGGGGLPHQPALFRHHGLQTLVQLGPAGLLAPGPAGHQLLAAPASSCRGWGGAGGCGRVVVGADVGVVTAATRAAGLALRPLCSNISQSQWRYNLYGYLLVLHPWPFHSKALTILRE